MTKPTITPKTNYREVAKKLNVRYLFGKYGIEFGRPQTPDGIKQGWSLVRIVPLSGWIFDTNEIVEAIANDPDWSIKYEDTDHD